MEALLNTTWSASASLTQLVPSPSSNAPLPFVPVASPPFMPPPHRNHTDYGGLSSQHEVDSASLLVLIGLLTVTILTTWLFKRRRVRFIHESGLSMIYGIIIGIVLRYCAAEPSGLQRLVTFRPEIFFYLLLPPIVFNAGYDLDSASFFGRFGPICLFAFVGTTISALVTGGITYAIVLSGLENLPLSLNDCLLLGSLLSATDTVTVLSVFSTGGVDAQLYALVFGESALNDAVAIALYNTVRGFDGYGNAVGIFVATFLGSVLIGIAGALIAALVTKHANLESEPILQSALFVVASYSTFLMGELAGLSGIVAILFCGITQAHYTKRNLSVASKTLVGGMFELISFMADSFIFCYLGLTIFTYEHHEWRPAFMTLSLVTVLFARAANIFPLAFLLNLCTGRAPKPVPFRHMIVMWAAGLRGAISFALAMEDHATESRRIILSTTLFIVAVTVIVLGGVSLPLVNCLGVIRRRAESIELSSVENMVNETDSAAAAAAAAAAGTSPVPPSPPPSRDAVQGGIGAWASRLRNSIAGESATSYARLNDSPSKAVSNPSGSAFRTTCGDEYLVSSRRDGCIGRLFRRLDDRYLVPFFCRTATGISMACCDSGAMASSSVDVASGLPSAYTTVGGKGVDQGKGSVQDGSLSSRLPVPASIYARRRSSVAAPAPVLDCSCTRRSSSDVLARPNGLSASSLVGVAQRNGGAPCDRCMHRRNFSIQDTLHEAHGEHEMDWEAGGEPTFPGEPAAFRRFSGADCGPIVWSFGSSRNSVTNPADDCVSAMPPLLWVGPPSAGLQGPVSEDMHPGAGAAVVSGLNGAHPAAMARHGTASDSGNVGFELSQIPDM